MNYVESLKMFGLSAKEIPCVTGEGAPTVKIEGRPGVLYMDTDTGTLYKCRTADFVNEVFGWERIGEDGGAGALRGKTVVCFGDSLFGMDRGDTSVASVIAEHTGAVVYNVGFGGTRMSVHPDDGYAPFSMWALADAVASGDFSVQDAHAAEGQDYFAEQLGVLKGIDFSGMDIALLHFGTNDFTADVALDDGTETNSTICGALRYSIGKLLSAYPKLRIFVSLPVFRCWTGEDGTVTDSGAYRNGNGVTLPDVCAALTSAAREYNIPVLDGYHGMGINRINASSFLADGTHLNENGRDRFGAFLAAGIAAQGASADGYENSGSGETVAYTNQIPISTDTDGTVFNGVGYREGYRLSSSGTLSGSSGMYVTGFIPVKYLDDVYLKNVTYNKNASDASNQRIAFYDGEKNCMFVVGANSSSAIGKIHDAEGNLIQFKAENFSSYDASGVAFFRINGSYIGADSIITVNEVIT